jgi:hypothetical protein
LVDLSTELSRVGLVMMSSELLLVLFRDGIGFARAVEGVLGWGEASFDG